MASRENDVWRLAESVSGEDMRLGGCATPTSRPAPLSEAAKARLRRIVARTPEAMVKITGRARGGATGLKAHLDYITRNCRLSAETPTGTRIDSRQALRALTDDWLLANAVEARGRPLADAAQAVSVILSMPPGTPPDRVEAAARTWARGELRERDWLMVRHDDTDHPHVHVSIRAVGPDGLRLAPGPADLQRWREGFAKELRRLGLEAEATPRQARGAVRKATKAVVEQIERTGREPRVRKAERQAVQREASEQTPAKPATLTRTIQARQDSIRRAYLAHAAELAQGAPEDRKLARDVERFVAEMPVPLTRRQAMAVELRQVLDRHPGRKAPDSGEVLHGARPGTPEPEPQDRNKTGNVLHGARLSEAEEARPTEPGAPQRRR